MYFIWEGGEMNVHVPVIKNLNNLCMCVSYDDKKVLYSNSRV